jgi:hypothetical protein
MSLGTNRLWFLSGDYDGRQQAGDLRHHPQRVGDGVDLAAQFACGLGGRLAMKKAANS